MKIPDRNSIGKMIALTIAAEASAFGMTDVAASPSAQNAADPMSTMRMKRSSVTPDGIAAW
jgi:hypothetical protein